MPFSRILNRYLWILTSIANLTELFNHWDHISRAKCHKSNVSNFFRPQGNLIKAWKMTNYLFFMKTHEFLFFWAISYCHRVKLKLAKLIFCQNFLSKEKSYNRYVGQHGSSWYCLVILCLLSFYTIDNFWLQISV